MGHATCRHLTSSEMRTPPLPQPARRGVLSLIRSVGIRQRIWTQLELSHIGRSPPAAFTMPRRAAAPRHPQSPRVPPAVEIVDAPVHSLGEEAHRVWDGDVDPLPVRERLHTVRLIVEYDHGVFAQAEDVVDVYP